MTAATGASCEDDGRSSHNGIVLTSLPKHRRSPSGTSVSQPLPKLSGSGAGDARPRSASRSRDRDQAGGWGWGTTSAGKKEPDITTDLCAVADWFEAGRVTYGSTNATYKIWMWNNIACTQRRAFICKYFPPRE